MSVAGSVVDELDAVVDRLAEVDPAKLCDRETVVALHRQLERLSAVTTRAVAAFDAAGAWEDDARSAASWLAHSRRLPTATAQARVCLGRCLRQMPAAEAAWLAGEVGEAQVALLARSRTPERAECFAPRRGAARRRGAPSALRLLRPGDGLLAVAGRP